MGELDLIADTARRILTDVPSEEDAAGWSPSAWRALERAGLTSVGVPEEIGGSGGGMPEAAAVLHAAGYTAAPVPLAEAGLVGGWLLAEAGIGLPEQPAGPLSAAAGGTAVRTRDGWVLRGEVPRVPWGGACAHLALLADSADGPVVALVEPADAVPGANLAGEPRDTVTLPDAPVASAAAVDPAVRERLRLRGALSRVLLMAGAAERVQELTTAYARERTQFGRPISAFQAVRHQVARLAAETAAMRAAAQAPADSWRQVAAAKVRAGRAAGEVAAIAHQVHGALGFTWEHRLRAFTTRLWAWREEYGGDGEWAAALGGWVLRSGPAALRSALDD